MSVSAFVPVRIDCQDEDLRFRVACFLSSRHLKSLDEISVLAKNGTVTLQGQVGSYYEKQIAISSSRRVAGVVSLVDELKVVGRAPL